MKSISIPGSKSKLLFGLTLFLQMFFLPDYIHAQDWFRSNPAGMALERIYSSTVALHQQWALSVEQANRNTLPGILRPYDNTAYTLEQRLLYERGRLHRRQWIFRDARGVVRINASLPADLASIGDAGSQEIPPFIELFSSDRQLSETRQYLASGLYTTRYNYRDGVLIQAETFLNNAPMWTDNYRYTRTAILRGVERRYHEAGMHIAAIQRSGSRPELPLLNLDLRDAPPIRSFVDPISPHSNTLLTETLGFIYDLHAARVYYETDSLGRVISETRYDQQDRVLALITNEWSGDRIAEIHWTAAADQGRIVFRYSGNDRISEDNYRNGILERKVRNQGDVEIEEIFLNGRVILRAVWRDGRKISEERLN